MTREEAIRILDPETAVETLSEIEYYGGFRGRAKAAQALHDACILAVSALREQEKRRWIPVEERLPQNYISVLVYTPTAEPLPMVHEAYIGDDGEWHSSVFYGIENEDVTRWMTMPKTPKEDV